MVNNRLRALTDERTVYMNNLVKRILGTIAVTAAVALSGFLLPETVLLPDLSVTASADTMYEIGSSTQTLTNGNTYITSTASNDYRIIVNGTVTLILKDGVTFYANKGFEITNGGVLNIRGETEGTGKLVVKADASTSANDINATAIAGNVNIYGGIITATGGNGTDGSTSAESVEEAAGKKVVTVSVVTARLLESTAAR